MHLSFLAVNVSQLPVNLFFRFGSLTVPAASICSLTLRSCISVCYGLYLGGFPKPHVLMGRLLHGDWIMGAVM